MASSRSTPSRGGAQADRKWPVCQMRLHRLAEVRRDRGLSRQAVAERLNTDVATVERQEDPLADLPLSVLYQWQSALGVPVTELVVDRHHSLSPPPLDAAQVARLMSTAQAIRRQAAQPSVQRMADLLIEQLNEIAPQPAASSPAGPPPTDSTGKGEADWGHEAGASGQ